VLEARLREEAGTDPRVHFIGFQNQLQMPIVYRLGDIYILPSRGPGETWGLGVNEAMASGCAIMMSEKAGGSADLVEEGVNGIRFDPVGGAEKCSQWVSRLLDNPVILADMKTASRRRIDAFSYQQIMDALLSPGLL
jgi:glycosyltransferase involved in cell wall biosynthesis